MTEEVPATQLGGVALVAFQQFLVVQCDLLECIGVLLIISGVVLIAGGDEK